MKNRIYKALSVISALVLIISQFSISSSAIGKNVQISTRIGELISGKENEERTVLIGGGIFGAKINQTFVSVVEAKSVPKLRAGDVLLTIGSEEIHSATDVEKALSKNNGEPVTITVKRGDSNLSFDITPTLVSGKYKLGIKLKDTATGIGTLTFIDKESGTFGGLGHGICEAESGALIDISSGKMTGVILGGIHKGEAGKPGELCGVLTGKVTGEIYKNSECGIFGKIDNTELDTSAFEEIKTAKSGQIHTGHAEILATVKNGAARRYSIEITELCENGTPTKSFKVKVTDKTLIALTGGIVRGMSGSPIIQDGKLVGAVTHVMVADPTEGYGIFIENMLNTASEGALPKAA